MRDFSWCGLAVDFKDGIVVSYSEGADVENHRAMRIDGAKKVLLNGELKYPKILYNRLAGIGYKRDKSRWKKWRHDMLFLSLGVAGVEFIKTEGWKYVSNGKDVPVMVETVLGSVTLILQKNGSCFRQRGILCEDEWFLAEKVVAVRVPRGRKVVVPPGYFIVFVNNSLNPAAVSIVVDKDATEEYAPFAESRGAAYYAIKKNARLEMVPNPQYRRLCPVCRLRSESVWKNANMSEAEDLLYTFLVNRHSMFEKFLSSTLPWDNLFTK
jgi:glucose-6-phosphate isomerase